tara:strand:+ start:45181 stop:45756 length:576 start_codon:yes stop_codon:yes gene_type:complete
MIDQGELFDIPSPCKRICVTNNRGYCKGCFRSRTERLNWLKYTDFQRQLIINLCEKRRLKVLNAKLNPHTDVDEEESTPQADLFADNTATGTLTNHNQRDESSAPQSSTQTATPDSADTETSQNPAPEPPTPEQPAAAQQTTDTRQQITAEPTKAEDTQPSDGPAPHKTRPRPRKEKKKPSHNDDQLDMFN